MYSANPIGASLQFAGHVRGDVASLPGFRCLPHGRGLALRCRCHRGQSRSKGRSGLRGTPALGEQQSLRVSCVTGGCLPASAPRFAQDHGAWLAPAPAPPAPRFANPVWADPRPFSCPSEKTRSGIIVCLFVCGLWNRKMLWIVGASDRLPGTKSRARRFQFWRCPMSKEKPTDDPRQQTDWRSHKQTDKPWKGNPETEQRPRTVETRSGKVA